MSEPPAPMRFPAAWWVLGIIFSFLIVSSLANTFQQTAAKEDYQAEQASLRQVVMYQQAMHRLGNAAGNTDIGSSLDTPVAQLIPRAKEDPMAAKIYAAMRDTQGRSIPRENLGALLKSDKPADKAFVAIYTTPKLKLEEAEKLAAALPKEPFVYQVARAEALSRAGDQSGYAQFDSLGFVAAMAAAVFVGCGGWLLGLGLWAAYAAARRDGKLAPLGHPMGEVDHARADALAFRASQLLVGYFVISTVLALLPMDRMLRIGLLATGLVGFIVFLYRTPVFGQRISLHDVGLRRENLGANILWGVAGFLANIPLLAVMIVLGLGLRGIVPDPHHPVTDVLMRNPDTLTLLSVFLQASILAPFWEEIMFRGTLLPALSRRLGDPRWGVVAASFLFAAIHPQGIMLWLALMSVAFMSSLLAYQTRSLVPSIVMHAVHNSLILLFALLMG